MKLVESEIRPTRRSSRNSLDLDVFELNPEVQRHASLGASTVNFPAILPPGSTPLLKQWADQLQGCMAEIQSLRQRVIAAENKAHELRWFNVSKSEEKLIAYTTLNICAFHRVLGRYRTTLSRSGRKLDSLGDEDRLLFALNWLGRGSSFSFISALSGVALTTVYSIVESVMMDLSRAYASAREIPSLQQLIDRASPAFKDRFGQYLTVLIPDGTSLILCSPLRNGKDYYCSYKGHNCLRYFIVVETSGRIVYLSALDQGSVTDARMWNESDAFFNF